MTDREIRLQAFVDWCAAHITGDEKGEAAIFLDHLFRAFGHAGLKEAGATCENRVRKDGGGTAFADLVWKPVVLVEMKKRGADLSNAVVLTDDGSTPVVDANWVVTSAYYNDNGNLEIQLTHKNSSGNSSGGQSGTDSSSSNTLEDLSNKAQELGDKAQELGDTAQNLGDTAQNLGDMATDAWNALQNGISGAQGN